MSINKEIEANKTLGKFMIFCCYTVAFLLVVAIIYGFTGIVSDILTSAIPLPHNFTRLEVLSYYGIGFLLFKLTKNLGDHWRSSEKNEIGTAVTNFPNPFYDPRYKTGPSNIQRQYRKLHSNYQVSQRLLKSSNQYSEKLEHSLKTFEAKIKVLIRHNNNVNRLMKSINYMINQSDPLLVNNSIRYILSECITVLEKDQSDKSITLFHVKDNRLVVKDAVRINAESMSKRNFLRGEGFAGHIWSTGAAEIVNYIDDNDQRFQEYGIPSTPIGAILGIPLKVDDEILGVLCLQSENRNGFTEADLRTVEFYAGLCTLITLYGKIEQMNGGGIVYGRP